jgi:ABC-type antimicrobial peptide transport system permease subunit
MSGCILIFVFIKFQLSFDRHFKDADRVYRFVTDWNYNRFDDYSSGVSLPFGPAAKQELPGIDKVARISRSNGIVTVKDNKGLVKFKAVKDIYFAEPELFDILQVKWLFGTSRQSLSAPNTAVLSEKTAQLLFGSARAAVGKEFTYWNAIPLRVVGVIADLPPSSSVRMDILVSYASFYGNKYQDWENVSTYNQCFMKLSEGASLAALEQSLNDLSRKYLKQHQLPGKQHYRLQPLLDIHFSERYSNFADTSISKKEVYALGVIAVFLIATACINFINLATAQSVNRSKEVGVRKVLGAIRKQLIYQFLVETVLISIVAVIFAGIIAELSLPLLSSQLKTPVTLTLFSNPATFLFLPILVIVVSFLAGAYPAMILSGFSPAAAIKNKVRIQRGNLSFRKALIILQFTVTVVLITATLVVMRQMEYIREKPLGFEQNHILMVNFPGDSISMSHQQLIRDKILHVKGVEMQSYFARPPLSGVMNTTNFYVDGRENKDFEVRLNMADEHYFNVFDLKFLAGKVYTKSDTANAYITNETFIKKIGISNPAVALGKVISQNGRTGPIVGVVQDFNDQSLKEQISPMIFYQEKRQFYNMGIKLDSRQIIPARKEIESIWTNAFPNEIYTAKFIDDDIEIYYESERVTGILLKTFGGLIMFIAFIGLFGLISFVAAQRTREMAIRRVLGATTVELVKMLNGSFVKVVLAANLIAWPLSYVLINQWLSRFAYRVPFSIAPFVVAMAVSMLLTVVVVSFRSYRAARANAVDSLKYE